MSKADFNKWGKLEQWAIADAAMLLLGVEPTGNYPPVHLKPDERIRYEMIMRAARQDLGGRLPTSWVSIYPGLRASPDRPEHVCVLPGDWITWARRRKFYIPKPLKNAAGHLPHTPGKKQRQQAELESLLQRIKTTAEGKGGAFARENMPGTKDQFRRLIKAHCPELGRLGESTINDYLKEAGYKFSSGRNSPTTDLWKRLELE